MGEGVNGKREVLWERLEPDLAAVTISGTIVAGADTDNGEEEGGAGGETSSVPPVPVPIVIATVDAPRYACRLDGTLPHLRSRGFEPHICHLLDVEKYPDLGPRRILSEGWRTVLLPKLLEVSSPFGEDVTVGRGRASSSFVLVAEDDAMLASGVDASLIVRECAAAFASDPDLDLLSLGHAWNGLHAGNKKKKRPKQPKHPRRSGDATNGSHDSADEVPNGRGGRDLLAHLRSGGGVHGTTLLALRFGSVSTILAGSSRLNRQTHFDQYLFNSPWHDLSVGLSDPPLVGWAETEVTLTSVGNGHRRRGGGRKQFLPPPPASGGGEGPGQQEKMGVKWVRRRALSVLTEPSDRGT